MNPCIRGQFPYNMRLSSSYLTALKIWQRAYQHERFAEWLDTEASTSHWVFTLQLLQKFNDIDVVRVIHAAFISALAITTYNGVPSMLSWNKGGGILDDQPPVSTQWIGVPAPAWPGVGDPMTAVAPDAPADWSSEVAGHYYINETTGTDSGRTYGTPTAPRKTLPNPITPQSWGARVEMHGIYTLQSGGNVNIHGSGTSSAPIWIVGITGDIPYFQASSKPLIYGSYIILDNLRFDMPVASSACQIGSLNSLFPADYICVRNCEIVGNTGSTGVYAGIGVGGSSSNLLSNIVIYNNYLHDIGPTYDIDQDNTVISVGEYVDNFWICANVLTNAAGTGIQIGPHIPGSTNGYIAGNTVSNTRQSGIWVKYGENMVISQNVVHDVQDRCAGTDSSPSKGIGAQYGPINCWYIFNEVYNCRYGFRVASTDTGITCSYYAIGNYIHDCDIPPYSYGSFSFDYPTGTSGWDMSAINLNGKVDDATWVVGNIVARCSSGILSSRSTPCTDTHIENNIIFDINHANGYHVYCENTVTSIDYNVHYGITGSYMFRYPQSTPYANLAAFQSGTGLSANSQEADPLFTNIASNDFTLQAGSPCINSGSESACYATYETAYGIDIRVDYLGNPRPALSASWDVGPIEVQ